MRNFAEVFSCRKACPILSSLSFRQKAQDSPIIPLKIFGQAILNGFREYSPWEHLFQSVLKMMVVGHASLMKIDLGKHEISCQEQPFSSVKAAFIDSQAGGYRLPHPEQPQPC